MTVTDILAVAGMNTLLGMGTVFAVLIFISGVISLFRYLPDKKPVSEGRAEGVPPAGGERAVLQEEEDELAAVIAAAVAAYCAAGGSESGKSGGEPAESQYIVRSIRRIGK